MPEIIIAFGQVWRDKDKRRSEDGKVRMFVVSQVERELIQCRMNGKSKTFYFNRARFGSGRLNDSFELVSDGGKADV